MPSLKSQFETIERARRLIANLKAHKISVPRESRLRLYLRTLEEFTKRPAGEIKHEDLRRWVCAYQEVTLLAWIFYQLQKPPQPQGWPKRFQKILKGTYFPKANATPAARDTQAELHFAAMARQLKYAVELDEKPDVIISYSGGEMAVAAKRPRSLETVRSNAEDAADQIVERGLDGLIFLDLTLAFAQDTFYWRAETPDAVTKLVDQLDAAIDARISSAASGLAKTVFGVYGFMLATVFVGPTWDHHYLWRRVYRELRPQAIGFKSSFFQDFARRSQFQENWRQVWKEPDAIYL